MKNPSILLILGMVVAVGGIVAAYYGEMSLADTAILIDLVLLIVYSILQSKKYKDA